MKLFFFRKEEKSERSRYYFLNLDTLKYVKIKWFDRNPARKVIVTLSTKNPLS